MKNPEKAKKTAAKSKAKPEAAADKPVKNDRRQGKDRGKSKN